MSIKIKKIMMLGVVAGLIGLLALTVFYRKKDIDEPLEETEEIQSFVINGETITSNYPIICQPDNYEVYQTMDEPAKIYGLMGEEIVQPAGVFIRRLESNVPNDEYCYVSPISCQGKNVVVDFGVREDDNVIEIYFPDGSLGVSSIYDCPKLEKAIFSNTVTTVEQIMNCDSLTEIVFIEGSEITYYPTISGLDSLEKIVMPDSVRYLGAMNISYCSALEEIELSKQLLYIEESNFIELMESLINFVISLIVFAMISIIFDSQASEYNIVFSFNSRAIVITLMIYLIFFMYTGASIFFSMKNKTPYYLLKK